MIQLKHMRYVCVQPANDYYTWQVETLIHNFIKHGINANYMDIVMVYHNEVPQVWRKLQQAYPYVRFFFYPDTRKHTHYIPNIYFNGLKQHIQALPELENDVLFTHDSDIVFTKRPDFNSYLDGDTWYFSDTNSYLNYDYIMQKGEYILDGMCDIVGIDKETVKKNNEHSGGAQYIVKNTTYEFWNKVEEDSVKLYDYFNQIEGEWVKNHEKGAYPIQKWTAGMWSYLWNGWYFGKDIKVDKGLDFGWVTSPYSDVEKYTILHNAGVTADNKDLFFKGKYHNTLPYNEELKVSEKHASLYYWEQVKEAGKKSCLL